MFYIAKWVLGNFIEKHKSNVGRIVINDFLLIAIE